MTLTLVDEFQIWFEQWQHRQRKHKAAQVEHFEEDNSN